ncbi:HDOD domain-containing protein [Sulfuriferula plumbiphila]|uniref:HDOD domain-containing protein n=1 Tax=Sulfuriferula plumbiphila TaxID=171865 RepID=A0A512L4F6_9PROT|nr:HDOD domain-containing protein [Sulfuriferula plumbiphila]BBP03818.1 HDOD domain-containing protein [Sulfuriferula plumbiphila]GEP29353.1 HDOD domain-containing protein [Sulfuriferula plumbiphila]
MQKFSDDANLPALGSAVSRVVQLASSDDEALQELTNFVLSDVALTQKILRLSNTVSYRTASGRTITTISSAIFLLGFDTVKTCALAMLLVDRLPDNNHAQSVRFELAQALRASVIGRQLARRSHFHDSEEAAIAALFKNLGQLLVASHDHGLYSEITELTHSADLTPARASMQVLGCSFDQLGATVLHDWKISDTLIHALSPLSARAQKAPESRQEWMSLVASFSSEAARLMPHLNDAKQHADNQILLARFGAALSLDKGKIDQLFALAIEEAHILLDSMGLLSLPDKPAELPGEIETGTSAQNLLNDFLLTTAGPDSKPSIACHASGKPINAHALLLAGVQDVTQMMGSGHGKLNELIMQVLETLYQGMGFRFATVCMKDLKSNQFRARVAIGEHHAARQAGFRFSATTTHDIFHLAIKNNADLMIADAAATKIHQLIPVWHRELLPDTRSFVVLPLVIQEKPLGLLYADRSRLAPEGVSADETALIKTLKSLLLATLNSR